jgi:serine/threonine-protein kinase
MQLPNIGDVLLGKYRLEKALGEGGMGIVFAARHDLLGQRVAVKLVRPEFATHAEAAARFLNEARAAARIESDHVARVLDVGTLESGLPYMVLEYLDGADLARVLHERGPLPVADGADYVLQAIEAVAHAHALGIIHRDLKPSNLFLARRPDGLSRVKVLDFGIAKVLGAVQGAGANMTRTNSSIGSPLYMSPEQLLDSKNVDHRSDIWALGVVAYELLTGRPPFVADNSVALFAAIQMSEPASMRVSRPDLGGDLDAAILKCLRRLPEERYSSVTELAASLAPFGTAIGAGAFANTKRIIPFEASPSPAPSPPPEVERVATQQSAVAAASKAIARAPILHIAASTAEPWSTTPPGPPLHGPPGGRLAALLGLGGLVAAALVATVLTVLPRAGPRAVEPVTAAAAASSASVSLEAAAPPSAASSAVAPPLLLTPIEDAPSSRPTVQQTVTPKANARPHATPPPADPAGGAEAARPKPPVVAAPASPRPNCNPPYDFDATGRKIWKRECP